MSRPDVKAVINIVEGMLNMPVWQDTFMLKRAHARLLNKLSDFKDKQSRMRANPVNVCERIPVFVEVYQNNLGIITLSRIVTTIGDSAFGKNVYSSYRIAKISAENEKRHQKFIAFVEVDVLPDKIQDGVLAPGKIALADGAILISNIRGAWFRDAYYKFDFSKKLFVKA